MAGVDRELVVRDLRVPRIGFGTWKLVRRKCERAVRDALEVGYRHIDTAPVYENEGRIGRALAKSDVPREEVFVTTKVWVEDADRDGVRRSAERSLAELRTDYIDLLLLHWPSPDVPVAETLSAMAELREQGKLRAYGASNFTPRLLREALEHGDVICDQVEFHPLLGQRDLVELAVERDLFIAAYSPLGRGAIRDAAPVLDEIGSAHGKSAGQVALRWLLEQGPVCALPKAGSHEHRVANLDVFDFELSDAERARIDALPKDRRQIETEFAPDWDR